MKRNIYSKYYDKYRQTISEIYKWRKAVLTAIKIKNEGNDRNNWFSNMFFMSELESGRFSFLDAPDSSSWAKLLELYKDYLSKPSLKIISNLKERTKMCEFYEKLVEARAENRGFFICPPLRVKPDMTPNTWRKVSIIFDKYKTRISNNDKIVRGFGDMGRIMTTGNGKVYLETGPYKENLGGVVDGKESKKTRYSGYRSGD